MQAQDLERLLPGRVRITLHAKRLAGPRRADAVVCCWQVASQNEEKSTQVQTELTSEYRSSPIRVIVGRLAVAI
jgi:hypothetical protein